MRYQSKAKASAQNTTCYSNEQIIATLVGGQTQTKRSAYNRNSTIIKILGTLYTLLVALSTYGLSLT